MNFIAFAAGLLAGLLAGSMALACEYPPPPVHSGEAQVAGGDILWAGFSDATDRYQHGVFGDRFEAGGLRVATKSLGPCELAVILPLDRVFEDLAPRIADLDGDGMNEVIVVETQRDTGASLAVYGLIAGRLEKLAKTANIGQTRRWLSPAGIADFNGDGRLDIAYVETPHIRGTLKFVSMRGGKLVEWARAGGLSNHRLGENYISSFVRHCDGQPVLMLPHADWDRIMAVKSGAKGLEFADVGSFGGAESLTEAGC